MPGARGAPAFEHVPLAPGFVNAIGNAHGGDSSLQHGPGAGIQLTQPASQGLSPLPAQSGAFLGSETAAPSGSGLITFRAGSWSMEKGSTCQGMCNPGVPASSMAHCSGQYFIFLFATY